MRFCYYQFFIATRIVGFIASLIIIVHAAQIDQLQDGSKSQKNNGTGEQNQNPLEPTSETSNDTDIYRRPGSGGGNAGGNAARPPGGNQNNTRPRNNTAVVNTKSAILFLPIIYFIVAN